MGSDLWFREFERHLAALEGNGTRRAYEKAVQLANKTLPNLIEAAVDRADMERKRRKEDGNG